VIEVKIPGKDGALSSGHCAFADTIERGFVLLFSVEKDAHPCQGQLFDYMLLLRSFEGLKNVYGVLTNYNEWRLYHLPALHQELGKPALPPMPQWGEGGKEEKEDTEGEETLVGGLSDLSLTNTKKPDDLRARFTDEASKHFKVVERKFHASGVYSATTSTAVVAIGAVLRKMFDAKSSGKVLPYGHSLRPYLQFKPDGYDWVTFPEQVSISFTDRIPDGHTSNFIILGELGSGRDGRVFLCCGVSKKKHCGAVLKFCSGANVERELAGWRDLFPKVRGLTLDNKTAVLLPYLYSPPESDYTDMMRQAYARASKTAKKANHGDIKHANCGFYTDTTSAIHGFVFDFSTG
jgi:hypothetical protein